jgi:hypothetical protein
LRKKGHEESPMFLRKKEGRRTYQGRYSALVIDSDNEASGAHYDTPSVTEASTVYS